MTVIHVALGGPMVVDPLLASDLPDIVKWLGYFTWHDGTVALVVCGAALIYSALRPGQRALAVFAAVLLLGIGFLGLGVALIGNSVLFGSPAPYAFVPIGLIALAGAALRR